MSANELETAIETLVDYIASSDDATQLLVGNLVAFLIEKKVIDINEYVEYTENSKGRILSSINDDPSGKKSKAVENIFDWHVRGFKNLNE
ncbi:hypothetical protein [Acinetobacter bereziniae]|uniref:hypothetical protein n=1 Tax=Acinetobacter bereziniae TaxID=106648 RepID=UPI000C2C05FD|nr:hypothetical protein [Acinetobacter bereziniae]ATZ64241.1 hypothetical protein BSR55_13125 [Acinetobacter bereziniae]